MSAVRGLRAGIPAACAGSPAAFFGKAACQRERRRRWQQGKRRGDGDYRANQALAQRAWADGRRDYWREWRAAHPNTPSATVWSSGDATASGMCHVLQRWTRQRQFIPFHQGLTVWCRGRVAILQRWTRARSN